jgi:hypothetical protein
VIRRHQGGYDWLQTEVEQLIDLVETQATQLEIAAAFPDRTWDQLRRRYCQERGIGSLRIEPKPIKDTETYKMYLTRVYSPRPAIAQSGEKWTKEDAQLLAELVDKGANQVQIAEAFPTRRWVLIRTKIKKLRGKDVVIPEVGKIKRNETIRDYHSRIGQTEYDVSVRSMTSTAHCSGGIRDP